MKTLARSRFLAAGITLLLMLIYIPAAGFADPPPGGREHIVLVHGFGRTGHDMRYLAGYFSERGYDVSTPTLPTFFGTFETCTAELESHIDSLDDDYTRIHLVGHSLGGLVIRNMLARREIPRLGRCFLIATPNSGSPLAGIVKDWIKPLYWTVPLYQSLQPGGVDIPAPLNTPAPEIGTIAGTKNALLFGRLINGPADGVVPLDSVPFEGMAGFAVVPYHHQEIHHREETARLVQEFLETGVFLSKAH